MCRGVERGFVCVCGGGGRLDLGRCCLERIRADAVLVIPPLLRHLPEKGGATAAEAVLLPPPPPPPPPFPAMCRYRYGPQPSELGGKRALDFILDNRTLSDTNRTLLLDIKLLAVRPKQ